MVATALIARLFLLTQPALMQIGWFARGYDLVMPWKDALVDMRAQFAGCGGWRASGRSASVARFAVNGGRCAPPCGCGAGAC